MTYEITVEEFPEYFDVTPSESSNGKTGIHVHVWTKNEEYVKDYAPSFARDWGATAILTATLDLYPTIIYQSHFDLTFRLSDYCLGWTFSERNFTILNHHTIVFEQ